MQPRSNLPSQSSAGFRLSAGGEVWASFYLRGHERLVGPLIFSKTEKKCLSLKAQHQDPLMKENLNVFLDQEEEWEEVGIRT